MLGTVGHAGDRRGLHLRNGRVPHSAAGCGVALVAGDNDSIHSDPRQFTVGTALPFGKVFACPGEQLAVNREVEFARHSGRPDGTVAVDHAHAAPHGSAAGPQGRAEGHRSFLQAIIKLGRRIDAEIEALRVERRGLRELLIKVVFRDAAVRREAKVSGKERPEGERRQGP